ncbi:MAG: polysaccharide biosynthesis/export family protein [Pseudomonadota bacterium]
MQDDSVSSHLRGVLRVLHKESLLIGASAVLLSACTITPGMRNEIDRGEIAVPGIEVIEVTPAVVLSEALATSAGPAANMPAWLSERKIDADGYRLGQGDVVRIVVWDHPELNNPSGQAQGDSASSGRLVEPDGKLFFPYIGRVQAAGLTPTQLREDIIAALSKFIKQPQIDVRITEFRSQRVYVTGEVTSPGPIFLNDVPVAALDAIASKGGFTELSNRRRILLTRDGVTAELHAEDLIYANASKGVFLKAGDIVNIPDISDDKIFLLGDFVTQKTILQGRTIVSLAEAITQGGGLDKLGANAKAIFIFRRHEPAANPGNRNSNSNDSTVGSSADEKLLFAPKVYAMDLTRAESLLLAERFSLKPRDVVYIASTDFSKYNRIINQLLPTISTYFQLDRLINN